MHHKACEFLVLEIVPSAMRVMDADYWLSLLQGMSGQIALPSMTSRCRSLPISGSQR